VPIVRPFTFFFVILALGAGPGNVLAQNEASLLQQQVADRERAFAQTMADRDHAAFTALLSEEAVFFGSGGVLRGKEEVARGWQPLFEGPGAPFSWEPEEVEVLESGTLAYSSGPVYDPQGVRVGTFNSVWRLHSDGGWRIVFDKGCPPCRPSDPAPGS
jgi:ketosteroid isomerase-like protein